MLKNLLLLLLFFICSFANRWNAECWVSSLPIFNYRYPDGTCKAWCDPPLKMISDYVYKDMLCQSPCDTFSYLYPDRSCRPTCDPDFIPREIRGVLYCDPPPCKLHTNLINGSVTTDCINPYNNCSKSLFELEDGTCTSSCVPPMIPSIKDGSAYCSHFDESCEWGKYKQPDGSCSSICSWPLKAHQYGFSWTCTSPCRSGSYLYKNRSCLTTCGPGFIPRVEGATLFCDARDPNNNCSESQYQLQDGSCADIIPTCSLSGSANETTNNCTNILKNKCEESYFQMYDGPCSSFCPSPMVPVIINGSAFCNSPCAQGRSLCSDGSCLEICKSYFSLFGPNGFGESSICPIGEFKLEHESCIDPCEGPEVPLIIGNPNLCYTPCPAGSYRAQDGTCQNGSVNVQVSIRYNISLDNFNSQDGSNRLVQYLAKALEIDQSNITILGLSDRENSTIIDAQVTVTPSPQRQDLASILKRAETMIFRLEKFVGSNSLIIINGTNLLEFKHSVEKKMIMADMSSNEGISIRLKIGLGLLALVLTVLGFIFYKKRKDSELCIVREKGNNKELTVLPNPNQPQATDCSLGHIRNDYQSSLLQPDSRGDSHLEKELSGAKRV